MKLFDLTFFSQDLNCLINKLEANIVKNEKVSVFTPNVDHIINNSNNEKSKKKYSESDYIIADGWPLVAVGRMKKISVSRITGVDLMDNLLGVADKKGYNVFFLGSTEETLNKLELNIKRTYPGINMLGTHHGYFDENNCEDVIKLINANKTNILFVGMGNPKQEIWIRENIQYLNCNISVGVGGAFNIFSGDISRAPKWIQNIGMEWFYRFLNEPTRLFNRYFIKYPKFIGLVIEEWRK